MSGLGPNSLKEAFVTDLEGTTSSEVVSVTLVVILAAAVRKAASSTFLARFDDFAKGGTIASLAVDFAFVVIPGILAVTLLSEHSGQICAGLLVVVCVGVVRAKQNHLGASGGSLKLLQASHYSTVLDTSAYVWDSLTEYRSILCIYTFISILAVDFEVRAGRLPLHRKNNHHSVRVPSRARLSFPDRPSNSPLFWVLG